MVMVVVLGGWVAMVLGDEPRLVMALYRDGIGPTTLLLMLANRTEVLKMDFQRNRFILPDNQISQRFQAAFKSH